MEDDFGYLSGTDDSAVDDLVSQAKDLSLLEQLSAINCSGFTDSLLPSHLEQRFNKLKSIPQTNKSLHFSKTEFNNSVGESERGNDRHGELGLKKSSDLGSGSSPSHSWDSSTENYILPEKPNPDGKTEFKGKSKRGSLSVSDSAPCSSESKSISSSLSSANSSRLSHSPPKKIGCFWFSPKKIIKSKSKEERPETRKTDEFLSDLGIFSVKEQQMILKKAMKEEEKINREAEKIVKWARQASMRMSSHDIEDELSDG